MEKRRKMILFRYATLVDNNFPVTLMSQCIDKFLNQYYSECYRSRVTNIPPAAAPVNAIVADDEDPIRWGHTVL